MRGGRFPHLHLQPGSRRDHITPFRLAEQIQAEPCHLEKRVGDDLDAVTDAGGAREGDQAGLRGHEAEEGSTFGLSSYLE